MESDGSIQAQLGGRPERPGEECLGDELAGQTPGENRAETHRRCNRQTRDDRHIRIHRVQDAALPQRRQDVPGDSDGERAGEIEQLAVQGGEIDIAISPQSATISALLSHVRKADIVNVYSLRHGAAEAIEAIAHGDENMSKVVGRAVRDIKLPPGTTIGAIVRGEEVNIAHKSTIIESNDHVIMFLVDKKYVGEVEKLFQPSPFFF